MRRFIYRSVQKALILTLMGAILATGALAVSLTHIYVTFNVSFGTPQEQQVSAVDALGGIQMPDPLPVRKPKVRP